MIIQLKNPSPINGLFNECFRISFHKIGELNFTPTALQITNLKHDEANKLFPDPAKRGHPGDRV